MAADSKPFQFSVRQMLAVLLALCVALALVTQLWHVGFVLALMLGGIAAGAWRRDWRLTAAASTALVIFVTTYAASWLQWGNARLLDRYWEDLTYSQLQSIQFELRQYVERTGQLPEALSDMPAISGMTDFWGHPFHYRKSAKNDSFELMSLGSDGKHGGTGMDADIKWGDYAKAVVTRLTLRQFLFQTAASPAIFLGATAASILTAWIWYSIQRQVPVSGWRMIVSAGLTTIAAVMVSVFLAGVHVAFSQSSGH